MAEGRDNIIQKLREHLDCPICTEEAELRMLPCQHSMCLSCIERIVSAASQDRRDPHCPYCNLVISKSQSDYPKALLANSLQEQLDKLHVAIKENKLKDGAICDYPGCNRHVDWQCKDCKVFICQRCSEEKHCPKSSCLHKLISIRKLKKQSEEHFEKWKAAKKAEINYLKEKRVLLASQIQQELVQATPDALTTVLSKHEKLRTSHQLEAMKVMEDGSQSVLDYYCAYMDKVMDTDFIRLVEQMSIGLKEQTTLGKCDTVLAYACYSVDVKPTGEILAGRNNKFTLCNSKGSVVKSVSVSDGNIISIQWYKGCIYTLCLEPKPGSKRKVIVYDGSNYNELRRWSVPNYKFISKLAVTNDKVYVADPEHHQLCVYSLTGETADPIFHAIFSSPIYLAISHPEGIIVSDWKANKVHSLRNDGTIRWTSGKVADSTGVCCDASKNVWTWSRSSKVLFLLSHQSGDVKAEIIHPKFSDIKDEDTIQDMCVNEDNIWVAARSKGQLRFDIQ
ncbi:uncharacterized protein [Watersipora subatra]|uniref:uncharacterized protein n=1 Tax=Watersipora subatra TaxID=2589382 RepID=UPI00355AE37C